MQMLGQTKRRSRSRANAPASTVAISPSQTCRSVLSNLVMRASVRNLWARGRGGGPVLPRSRPHRGIGHDLREQAIIPRIPAKATCTPLGKLQRWIRGSRALLFMLCPLTPFLHPGFLPGRAKPQQSYGGELDLTCE